MTEENALNELEQELAALEQFVVEQPAPEAAAEPAPEPEAPKAKSKKSKKAEAEPERHPTGWSPEPTEDPNPAKAGIAAQLYGAAKLKAKFLKR